MVRHLLAVGLATWLVSPVARAEDVPPRATPERWALRASVAAGLMISADQRERLELDAPGGTLRISGAGRPFDDVDWLEGELTAGASVVGPGQERPGGAIDVQLAVRVAPEVDGVVPFGVVGFGVVFTGPLARPVASVALGAALPVSEELAISAELSLLHVLQNDGPGYSDDALFLAAGVGLWWRPVSRPQPLPPRIAAPPRRAPPPPPPAPVVTPGPPDEDLVTLLERAIPARSLDVVMLVPPVLFEHGDATLTAAAEVTMHDVLERVLAADPRARIVIQGHADATGTPEVNLPLSMRRAEVVASWLEAHGVPRARMVLRGEGTTRPLVVGGEGDLARLAPDRRVTVRIELETGVLGPDGPDGTARPGGTSGRADSETDREPE